MKNVVKKVIIYLIVGLLQAGLFVTFTEAAAKPNNPTPFDYDQRQDPREDDGTRKEREIERNFEVEMRRHEREMKRKPNESDRDWKNRRQKEEQRHEKNLEKILKP